MSQKTAAQGKNDLFKIYSIMDVVMEKQKYLCLLLQVQFEHNMH